MEKEDREEKMRSVFKKVKKWKLKKYGN
jgi:hypothetical protein